MDLAAFGVLANLTLIGSVEPENENECVVVNTVVGLLLEEWTGILLYHSSLGYRFRVTLIGTTAGADVSSETLWVSI